MTDGEKAEALIAESWRILRELVTTGTATLENGVPIAVESDQLIQVLKWLASLKPPKTKKTVLPEDFSPTVTQHAKAPAKEK